MFSSTRSGSEVLDLVILLWGNIPDHLTTTSKTLVGINLAQIALLLLFCPEEAYFLK